MLRKILISLALAMVGFMTLGGIASADPGYGGEDDTDPALGVSGDFAGTADDPFPLGEPFLLSLSGFEPGETVDITVAFTPAAGGTPSGLRGVRPLAALAAAPTLTVVANQDGRTDTTVSYNEAGIYTFTAVGRTSGVSNSVSVVVGGSVGTGGSGGSAGAAGGTGGSSGNGGSAGAAGGGSGSGGGSSSSADGSLAFTGTSLAAPLAIGFAALLAGLALLFFGTRGVIRRRGSQSPVG